MGAMRRMLAAVACCSVHALHFPIAYGSRLSLPSLPVKQLCIDCKKPEDDPRAWRDEIRRRAAQCGCGYREGRVVFASDPSPEDLAVLCGDDGTARQLENTVLEPRDRNDWPVYDRLLLSDLYRFLRNRGIEKDWGLLWLPLDGETLETPKCVIKRGIHVGLTTFVDTRGECRLLMSRSVKNKIVAKESLYSMLQREPFDSLMQQNLKVQTRPGIYPSYSGTLDVPATQGSISAPRAGLNRAGLNSMSLIEYSNLSDDRRNVYLKNEFDPNAAAVGLKRAGGYVMDYPPQLLEPAFDNDLPPEARRFMKLKPGDWVEKSQSIQELVRDWRPDFLNLTEPLCWGSLLKDREAESGYLDGITERKLQREGPALTTDSDVVLLPTYPASHYKEVEAIVGDVENLCQEWALSIRVAPREEWIVFDNEGAWENRIQDLGGTSQEYAVLACFTNGEDRKRIKDAAARSNLTSQGVNLAKPQKYSATNIVLGINNKLGGQAELCDLAEKGTVFVAYDLSHQRGVSLAVSVALLGCDGRMTSGPENSRPQRGEALDPEFLRSTLKRSVAEHERQTGEPVKRVVVYRDGRFRKTEAEDVEACLGAFPDCQVDLVEITKSGPEVLRCVDYDESKDSVTIPKPGFFLQLRERAANVITRAQPVWGLTQPILVTHVSGTTPSDQILTEVYKASSLRVYSDRHTRLPINLHYADRRAGDELAGAMYPYRDGLHAA